MSSLLPVDMDNFLKVKTETTILTLVLQFLQYLVCQWKCVKCCLFLNK